MIRTVFSAALPMGERLLVRKNRIGGTRRTGPRVSIVTGTHGDELEGQFIAFELARRLGEQPQDLAGTVDIYPAVNPLGLSAHERGVPHFDIDLDRTFPGSPDGDLTEAMAHAVLSDILGSSVCIDVHSASIHMQEVTQVHIDEDDPDTLVRLASLLNVRLVWVRRPTSSPKATLAHALNAAGVPTLVVDMGAGMRLNEDAGVWLVEGLLRLLESLHAWTGPTIAMPAPRVTDGRDVLTVTTEDAGIFLPRAEHGTHVSCGQVVGIVADPLTGTVRREVTSPCDGLLFSLRTYPLVYPGSLLSRILRDR